MEVREAQVVDPTHLELAHPTQVPPGAKVLVAIGVPELMQSVKRGFKCLLKGWLRPTDRTSLSTRQT